MTTAPSTAEGIVVRLVEAMREIRFIGKDQKNTGQGFNFRGIDDLLNAVGPAFRKHGIIIVPTVTGITHDVREGRNAKLNHYIVTVAFMFMTAGTDDHVTVITYGEAMDAGDKGVSKAMSVALRTALIQLLAIPTGEPDPDHDSYELSTEEGDEEKRTKLRRQIAAAGATKGLSTDVIAKSFLALIGAPIQAATEDQLREYLAAGT